MTWETMLAAMERAHPCLCGGSIETFDRNNAPNLSARVRAHLTNCPKRKMLSVVCAATSILPRESP